MLLKVKRFELAENCGIDSHHLWQLLVAPLCMELWLALVNYLLLIMLTVCVLSKDVRLWPGRWNYYGLVTVATNKLL